MSESYEPLIGNRYNEKKRGTPGGMPLSCLGYRCREQQFGLAYAGAGISLCRGGVYPPKLEVQNVIPNEERDLAQGLCPLTYNLSPLIVNQ